ncbi:hypothetical protein Franean1_2906 [Parafrankia sp. EAN1pec]|nr:hypothetical protein Franean1_2906 [Frankia sp. EAN1pec]
MQDRSDAGRLHRPAGADHRGRPVDGLRLFRNPGVGAWGRLVDHVGVQVISAADPQWIFPFTGLKPTQFRRLVRLVAQRGGDRIADGRPGRPQGVAD